MLLLLDSDILIDVLRKDRLALLTLEQLFDEGPVMVSVISRMEVIRGCLNRESQQQAERLLKQMELVSLDTQISKRADALVTQYFLSHQLAVADALIAATEIEYDLLLLSKNQRDYRFITGLQLLPYPITP